MNFSNSNLSILSDLQKIENKEIRLSGVITEVEHKETQKGKKFGILHMEDFFGAYKFFLFGDDYTPPNEVFYLRQEIQSQFNGLRLVAPTKSTIPYNAPRGFSTLESIIISLFSYIYFEY